MALHSKSRRQEYSVLPGTELYPLQDIGWEDVNNLPAEQPYLPSIKSEDLVLDSRCKSADDDVARHDHGGFVPVPELGFQDDVQQSDETCPLCGGEVVTKSEKAVRPGLFSTLFPRTSGFLRHGQEYLNDHLRESRFYGWRMGVLFGCCTSFFVLCCNIGLVVVGAKRHKGYNDRGIADLMYGDEATISRWNTVLHLFINMLSSILLASSNYTMQVLSSPTRGEIDRAHQHGDPLEIGILSTRNLVKISRKRAVVCVVLALSSIPLHLFYNAATFKVIASNQYNIFAIDQNSIEYQYMKGNESIYTFMEGRSWESVYTGKFVSGYSDVYLVVDQVMVSTTRANPLSTRGYLPWGTAQNISTLLGNSNMPGWITYSAGNSTSGTGSPPDAMHVVAALARQTDTPSRIQISLPYMTVVIAFNVLKLCIMASALIGIRSKHVVTLGDAIASFLECPDPITRESFPQDVHNNSKCQIRVKTPRAISSDDRGIRFYTQTITFARTVPYADLVQDDKNVMFFISLACLALALTILAVVRYVGSTNSWFWGTASEASSFLGNSGGTGTFNAWLANFPQVLLSMCYVNLNTLCTAMAGADEWNRLGDPSERKGLRVTEPRGSQRGTYFLQLPYRWAMPLIAISWMLHWLLSQSFFLVRIEYFDREGRDWDSKSACGVSHASLVTFFAVGLVLYAVVQLIGRVSMIPRLPPAGSSSLVISAACHPPATEENPHEKEVSWGLITQKHPPFARYYSLSGDVGTEQSYGQKALRMRGPQRAVQKGVQSTVSGAAFNSGIGLGA